MFTQPKLRNLTFSLLNSMNLTFTVNITQISNVFQSLNKITIKFTRLKQLSLQLMRCGLLDAIWVKLFVRSLLLKTQLTILTFYKDSTLFS